MQVIQPTGIGSFPEQLGLHEPITIIFHLRRHNTLNFDTMQFFVKHNQKLTVGKEVRLMLQQQMSVYCENTDQL